tara:strand:+ start:359 stop:559 length:201 start_codon:yes stop_codon:yes gene_type:complete
MLVDALLILASGQSVIAEIRALQSASPEFKTALIAVGRIASATAIVLQGVDAQLQKPVSRLALAKV